MKLVLLWCNLQYITLFEFPEKKTPSEVQVLSVPLPFLNLCVSNGLSYNS